MYEDPLSCNHFFKCANGTLTHEQCENGLLFEPATALAGAVHNHCSYNWAAQCAGVDKVMALKSHPRRQLTKPLAKIAKKYNKGWT